MLLKRVIFQGSVLHMVELHLKGLILEEVIPGMRYKKGD